MRKILYSFEIPWRLVGIDDVLQAIGTEDEEIFPGSERPHPGGNVILDGALFVESIPNLENNLTLGGLPMPNP